MLPVRLYWLTNTRARARTQPLWTLISINSNRRFSNGEEGDGKPAQIYLCSTYKLIMCDGDISGHLSIRKAFSIDHLHIEWPSNIDASRGARQLVMGSLRLLCARSRLPLYWHIQWDSISLDICNESNRKNGNNNYKINSENGIFMMRSQ